MSSHDPLPFPVRRAIDDIVEAVRDHDDARINRLLRDFAQVADITALFELRRKLSAGSDSHSARRSGPRLSLADPG